MSNMLAYCPQCGHILKDNRVGDIKRKYMIIGQKPIIFKSLARRKEIIDELKTRFCEMASQYKKVMTPELQQTIQEYYKKHNN